MHVKKEALEKLSELGKRYKYPLLILGLGLVLLLLPTGDKEKNTGAAENIQTSNANKETFQLSVFTEEVEKMLSNVSGAGKVQVLFTQETDGVRDYLHDEHLEQGSDDSRKETETVILSTDTGETLVTVTETFPTFRGAVVICQGAGNASVTLAIKEAISSLTGLGMDKITVLKMD